MPWLLAILGIGALLLFNGQESADSVSTGDGDASGSGSGASGWSGYDSDTAEEQSSMLSSKVKLSDRVAALIEKYSAAYGVDPDLAKAQAWTESNGNQSARSSVGAVGVYQLMPATAKDLQVNPYDEEENVAGGIKYLSQLLRRYNGDQTRALAAYNAGMGNVDKYGGVPPFAETQNYIKKIFGLLVG